MDVESRLVGLENLLTKPFLLRMNSIRNDV